MTSNPNALCFGSDLPGAGVPCRVEISSSGLSLRLNPESPPDEIPFDRVNVGAGGLDHDQLVLKWVHGGQDRTLYLKEPGLIAAFRRAAPAHLVPHLERTAAGVRQARVSQRTVYGIAIGSLVGVIVLLWLGSDAIVRQVVDQIPLDWERMLGETARAQFMAGQSVIKDGPAVAAVEEITKRLADQVPNNPYQFQITVVRSDVVNAFALPGGYVVVFTGLLRKAGTPEEVAGVLAHELNHVLLRHAMSRLVKNVGVLAVVTILVGDQQGGVGLAKRLGVDLLTLKFGREQETEADVEGLRLLYRAKIPTDGMIRFFEQLSENDKLQVELLSTHPMSSARAERLKLEAVALGKQEAVPFTFAWAAVQETIQK